MMKIISIVLPVFNEEAVLPLFHAELCRVIDKAEDRYRFEVVYVLDRSPDASYAVLEGLAARDSRIRVLHLSRRFGHQMSLVAGIDFSRGDAVIMMDCDLQHPPETVLDLVAAYEQGYDIVHTIRRYDAATPWLKRFSSRMFYTLQNALSPVEIPEGAADFRLISRKVADVFKTGIREQNQFLRGLFQWVGFSSTTVQFVSRERGGGATKYRARRLLGFSVQGITSFSRVPLRAATLLGGVLSASSLLYGSWSLIGYFVTRQLPPGYSTLVVAVMFLGGLQLLVLGIIGEYIGAIFDEVKRRPLYVVDNVIGGERNRAVQPASRDWHFGKPT